MRRIKRNRLVKNNVFLNLKNPITQYFIGLIATDGCISEKYRVELALEAEDKDILLKYKKFLRHTGTLKLRTKNMNGKAFYSYKLSFRNKEITKTLSKYGIIQGKTFNLQLKIPITFHMLRGIIDGDGCFMTGTVNRCAKMSILTASKEFSIQLSMFLSEYEIEHKVRFRCGKYYYIDVVKQASLLKLINYLYKNTRTFIKRKHVTALQIRNSLIKTVKFGEPVLGIPSQA